MSDLRAKVMRLREAVIGWVFDQSAVELSIDREETLDELRETLDTLVALLPEDAVLVAAGMSDLRAAVADLRFEFSAYPGEGADGEGPLADLLDAVLALIPEGAVLVTDPEAFIRQVVQDIDEADRSSDGLVDAEAIGNIIRENLRELDAATPPAEGLPSRSRDAILALGDLFVAEHGESCDCDTCLAVQPLVDAALAPEQPE